MTDPQRDLGDTRSGSLDGRPGLQTDARPNHPLTAALRKLVRDHRLSGAVLLTFDDEQVGINSSATNDEFGAVMERLGDLILAKLDDGLFDTCLHGGDDAAP